MKNNEVPSYWDRPKDHHHAKFQIIRILRLYGCTWGRIGELIGVAFNNEVKYQMDGKELCDRAAKYFGEDPNSAPWN